MGIANNSKIYYKSGSRTVSSSKIIDNGTSLYPMPALQFLINEADGNPGVGEYTQAEYVIIPIMDTTNGPSNFNRSAFDVHSSFLG